MDYLYTYFPRAILKCQCGHSFPLDDNGRPNRRCPSCGRDGAAVNQWRPEEAAPSPGKESAPPEKPKSNRSDPKGLSDVIGNGAAIKWIETVLSAFRNDTACLVGANKSRHPFPHTLLSGPGGTGKTMIAEIIAREIGRNIHLEMGQSLTTPARVGDILREMKAGEILYIDEMHGLRPACQETLYRAMEDGIYVPVCRAGAPVMPPITLKPFTIFGSTTDEWGLLPSLIQRFRVRVRLERLTPTEISAAMLDRAKRTGIELTPEAAGMIGERSHGTPRLAIGLLDSCVATAKSQGEKAVDFAVVDMTCELLGIDKMGLDSIARKYLKYLAESVKPVRLNVLATKLDGLSRLTVERRIEPDLVWLGLIDKGSDGRRLTDKGRRYIKGF